jgi:phytol kinase
MEREEYKRKAVHITMGLWAFFPLVVTRYQALTICFISLLLVLFVFREHRLKAVFELMARKEDYIHGYLMGPLVYILAVMFCVGFYPPYIAAASFAIMAFGDGVATLIGKNFGVHTYPYSDKTMEGTLAFLGCGFFTTVIILGILTHVMTFEGLPHTVSVYSLATIALLGSVTGGLIETLPFEKTRNHQLNRAIIDDNFFVPVIAGLVMTVYTVIL